MPTKKIVALTGATRGLGLEMAREFAQQGFLVWGCGTNKQTVAKLTRELGHPHGISLVDVSCGKQVACWAERLIEEHGAPDFLINNAGVINSNAPLWSIGADEFSRVIDVNLKGTANAIRAFCPAMIENGRGVIVNFSSAWGRSTSAEVAPYCASKWGVEGLTKALAQELPRGLTAVALNPGIINTEMLQKAFGDDAARYESPQAWVKRAVLLILGISGKDNGRSMNV